MIDPGEDEVPTEVTLEVQDATIGSTSALSEDVEDEGQTSSEA